MNGIHQTFLRDEDVAIWNDIFDDGVPDGRLGDGFGHLIEVQGLPQSIHLLDLGLSNNNIASSYLFEVGAGPEGLDRVVHFGWDLHLEDAFDWFGDVQWLCYDWSLGCLRLNNIIRGIIICCFDVCQKLTSLFLSDLLLIIWVANLHLC